MLNVAIMVVLLTVAAAIATFAGYSVARHRAQSAADLAALAAARVEGSGVAGAGTDAATTSGTSGTSSSSGSSSTSSAGPPAVCAAALRVAGDNGATMTGCDLVGTSADSVVTIRVRVEVSRHPPGLPEAVSAEANAAPVR